MDGDHKIKQAYKSILNHDFEQAIEWFQQAVSEEPNNAEYHYRLSITYARSNKLISAMEHARHAVRLQPDQFVFRYHYRNVRARELVTEAGRWMENEGGDLNRAVTKLKQAIQLDVLCLEAYVLLAVAYMGLQRYSLAEAAIKEALKLDPQREDILILQQQLEQREQTMKR